MSRLEEVESGLDKTEMGYYPYRDLAEVARALAAEVDELRAKLDHVRSEIGCARGQRTTQYCADLERTMKERDEYKRRLDAVVAAEPETDIAKAVHGRLYLVMFSELFGGIPEALHFRRDKDGEWFWSKFSPMEGGPLYGSSNTVVWFAEIRAVAIAEGRES